MRVLMRSSGAGKTERHVASLHASHFVTFLIVGLSLSSKEPSLNSVKETLTVIRSRFWIRRRERLVAKKIFHIAVHSVAGGKENPTVHACSVPVSTIAKDEPLTFSNARNFGANEISVIFAEKRRNAPKCANFADKISLALLLDSRTNALETLNQISSLRITGSATNELFFLPVSKTPCWLVNFSQTSSDYPKNNWQLIYSKIIQIYW